MTDKPLIRPHMRAGVDLIPPVVELVSRLASQWGLDSRQCSRLEVAVEEACTNVVDHAFGQEGEIRLEVRRVVPDSWLWALSTTACPSTRPPCPREGAASGRS